MIFFVGGRLSMAVTKVTQKELDLIRVEAEAIKTTDDKYFAMERLHKYLEFLDSQIDTWEETGDYSKREYEKILALQKYAQEIRQYIMSRPIGPRRMGLFVEYPEGYEG